MNNVAVNNGANKVLNYNMQNNLGEQFVPNYQVMNSFNNKLNGQCDEATEGETNNYAMLLLLVVVSVF